MHTNTSVLNFYLSSTQIRLLYFLLGVVYVAGLFIPLMEPDSAQHATMAMRMHLKGDYLSLYRGENPYLDKPHMHFWLAAFAYKVFWITHWAYRIPSLLFTILGAYSAHGLAKHLYGPKAAAPAALVFLSAQAIILAGHDVRTDAVLTGATIFAVWQFALYVDTKKIKNILLGAIGLGIAFSTKGMIAVVVSGACIFCHLLYTRQWNSLCNWRVLVGIFTFALTISPMLYAYYLQFDMHPELVVNGRTGVSGIRFILWDQSFDRLSSKGFEESSPDYFFFFHTLLWAFLPWAVIVYVAFFQRIRQLVNLRFQTRKGVEFLTLGGVGISLLLMSFSQYKLPHYLNVLFPILAVFVAGYLVNFLSSWRKLSSVLLKIQIGMAVLASVLVIVLCFGSFGVPYGALVLCYIALFGLLFVNIFKKQTVVPKILMVSVLMMVAINFPLNTHFYPNLVTYQAGKKVAHLIENEEIDVSKVYILGKDTNSWTLDFYTERLTPHVSTEEVLRWNEKKWLFLYDHQVQKLRQAGVTWSDEYEVEYFWITRLTLPFLNPNTRVDTLDRAYLINIDP